MYASSIIDKNTFLPESCEPFVIKRYWRERCRRTSIVQNRVIGLQITYIMLQDGVINKEKLWKILDSYYANVLHDKLNDP